MISEGGQPENTRSDFCLAHNDAADNRHKEPACALCVEHFTFNDRQKTIFERSLRFAQTYEYFAVTRYEEIVDGYGSSEWSWSRFLESVARTLETAWKKVLLMKNCSNHSNPPKV